MSLELTISTVLILLLGSDFCVMGVLSLCLLVARGYLVFYLFIFTFVLTKLEFGFCKSHIYGQFTPVKGTFTNKYNWINANNESSH